jgi:benzylsuccinate CoA-transferase BbsF subunit/naphthyl-2-methylsuccinate CoA transferase subunit
MILGDLGAEIIRVESITHFAAVPTRGYRARVRREDVAAMGHMGSLYPERDPGERPWNRFAPFNCHGRNKLSMTVDLERPEGVTIFKRLVRISDIFLENNSAEVVEKLGLTYPILRAENPGLIMLSMSGFGGSGPYKYYKGIGLNIEALCGFAGLRGYVDGDPAAAGGSVYMDAASGVGAAYAAMAALRLRDRTGRGQIIDFAQAENMVPHIAGAVLDYTLNRRLRTTLGNAHRSLAPHGVYPCAPDPEGVAPDRWLTLAVGTDRQFRALCRVIGRPELAADRRFRGVVGRHRHREALDAAIAGWTRDQDPEAAARILQEAGVPAGPVLDEAGACADPHLGARGFFHEVAHPEAGTHRYPGHPFVYADVPLRFETPAPRLGEHNAYVYKELLGASDAEYARLEAERHIGRDYVPEIT